MKAKNAIKMYKKKNGDFLPTSDMSSGKHHFLSVPNGMKTCQAAIAWTFGVKPLEYRPSVET